MQILVLIQNIQTSFTVSEGIIMVSSPAISVVYCRAFFFAAGNFFFFSFHKYWLVVLLFSTTSLLNPALFFFSFFRFCTDTTGSEAGAARRQQGGSGGVRISSSGPLGCLLMCKYMCCLFTSLGWRPLDLLQVLTLSSASYWRPHVEFLAPCGPRVQPGKYLKASSSTPK